MEQATATTSPLFSIQTNSLAQGFLSVDSYSAGKEILYRTHRIIAINTVAFPLIMS